MVKIGCHLSSSKGFLEMGKEAEKIGGNVFQFFTRNPRGAKAKALNVEDVEKLVEFSKERGIGDFLAHAPYTLNPCSKDEDMREFVFEIMSDDLRRLEYLPGSMYNFHPGCHVGQGEERGIELIANLLNRLNEKEHSATILLETMAGKGTEIGGRFEQLRDILEQVEDVSKVGICLDTCHVFDGGYDLVGRLDEVMEEFDRVIGRQFLKAVHLNDSKNVCGSHKDRHEKLGEGEIGKEAFVKIVNHPMFRELPFYLETPNEMDGYKREIEWVKGVWRDEK